MSAKLDAIISIAQNSETTLRDMARLLNEAQEEVDRLNELIDAAADKPWDSRIVVRVDDNPKLYRFSNIDALADWLAEGWK
jgi:hypothetical protein